MWLTYGVKFHNPNFNRFRVTGEETDRRTIAYSVLSKALCYAVARKKGSVLAVAIISDHFRSALVSLICNGMENASKADCGMS